MLFSISRCLCCTAGEEGADLGAIQQAMTGVSTQRSSAAGDIRTDIKMGDTDEGVVQKKFQREPHPSRSTVASLGWAPPSPSDVII